MPECKMGIKIYIPPQKKRWNLLEQNKKKSSLRGGKKQTPNAKFHKPGPITGGMYHKFLTSPGKNYSGLDGNASFSETFTTEFVGTCPFSDHWSPLWGFPGSRPWVKNGDERSRYFRKAGPIGVRPPNAGKQDFDSQAVYIYIYRYIRIYMKLYIMQVNKTCINTQLKHARSCSRQMKDIFSCWKSARLPLIFGNYIFGNYSFGKYFLSLWHLTGFRLKKSMGIFMTIGDPCGNFDHLDMAPFTWLASHRVWEIHGAEFLENMEPKKNRAILTEEFPIQLLMVRKKHEEKKPTTKYQQIRIKRLLPLSPKKEKKVDLEDFKERCFFSFDEFFVDVFGTVRSTDFVAKNRDLFFV